MTTLYKERKRTINLRPCRRTEASMAAYACQEKINDSTILKNKCPVRTRHQALFCSWTLAVDTRRFSVETKGWRAHECGKKRSCNPWYSGRARWPASLWLRCNSEDVQPNRGLRPRIRF